MKKVRKHPFESPPLVQVSPVLAWMVTGPDTEKSPADTLAATRVELFTNTGFGESDTIVVVVLPIAPLPWSRTVCTAPAVPPLLSVNVSVPVRPPIENGLNATLSEQLLPGAIGDTALQFWVVVKFPETPTFVTCSGAEPEFVTVTVFGALVEPIG